MRILIDTNILARLAEPGHAMYPAAFDSTAMLRRGGAELCIVPQGLYEFWVVCTRPTSVNGLGKSVVDAHSEVSSLLRLFTLLNDIPAIFPEWVRLVVTHAVLGKNAYDARLAAAMSVHGLTHLLTFNAPDFQRFTGLTVLTPAAVLSAPHP